MQNLTAAAHLCRGLGRVSMPGTDAFNLSCAQVQYLHPKDGVYPEKVNAGRTAVNANPRRIGANPNPVSVRLLMQSG